MDDSGNTDGVLQRRLDETQQIARLGSWELQLGDHAIEEGALWWSAETYRQLGYAPGEVVPSVALYLARIPEGERETAVEVVRAAIAHGTYDAVHRIEPAPGVQRFVHHHASVVDDGDGRRLVGTMQDITDRMVAEDAVRIAREGLEQRVAERTAALAASVRELEEFSYSISHDLRAPLRFIDGFARILVEEHAHDMAPEAREHLERIVRASAQMASLIDGLLDFTRVGRQNFLESTLDMDALVDGALEQLRADTAGRAIAWERQALPPARGDAALVRLAWMQLLANAIKFTRGREPARITIGSEVAGGAHWYFVEDNGAGFDERYAARLFGVFQRLHRVEEFEGPGVGLAIAQRAVQRHGGAIEARGELGRGARVRFRLGPA